MTDSVGIVRAVLYIRSEEKQIQYNNTRTIQEQEKEMKQCMFMDVHGCPWMFLDVYRCLWMFMDVHGFSWIFMHVHACSCMLMHMLHYRVLSAPT